MLGDRFLRDLAGRLSRALYTGVEVSSQGADQGVHFFRGEKEVFIYLWKHGAQAIVFQSEKGPGLCMNYWDIRRGSGENPIDEMWLTFWAMEEENRELERVLWMHGPALPALPVAEPEPEEEEEAVPKAEVDVFTLFG